MRWVHLAIVLLFAFVIVVFAFQNFETVSLDFLGFSIRAPLALAVVVIYLLGMATGGSLLSLLRRSVAGSRIMGD